MLSTLESVLAETWGYSFFSDRQISGQSYPLHIMIKDCEFYYSNPDNLPEYEDVGLDIDLMSLSESYYKHVLSVWEANDGLVGSLGSVGLGEIVRPIAMCHREPESWWETRWPVSGCRYQDC